MFYRKHCFGRLKKNQFALELQGQRSFPPEGGGHKSSFVCQAGFRLSQGAPQSLTQSINP